MAPEDVIIMTRKELKRLGVVQKVLEKEMKQKQAGEILDLSDRQIRRIRDRVEKEGEQGVLHRLRGQKSNRKKPEEFRERILRRYKEKYGGFGPTLACEKLGETDGLKIGVETLRLWMLEAGLWAGRRSRKEHRQWRERKAHFGEMVQMDGSHHDWFEGRGPQAVLMGYIDDATGMVYARFYEYEGTFPAMDGLRRYFSKYGIPQSLYLDKHTTYKSPAQATVEDMLEDRKPLSEFERACGELGIRVIHANSPQAKGRIERLFGTFQDRVVKEMRLQGLRTIEEGNRFLEKYLPQYNRRFKMPPREGANLHGKVPGAKDLDRILCIRSQRKLRNDWTVMHENKWYQITGRTSAKTVAVERGLDGKLRIYDSGRKALSFKEIPERPRREIPEKSEWWVLPKPKAPYRLPAEHPWRKWSLKNPVIKMPELPIPA